MTWSIFGESGKRGLFNLLHTYQHLILMPYDDAYQLGCTALRYYRGDQSVRHLMRPMQLLETRWYESLASDASDYTVYDDPAMIPDVYACWDVYSRRYLKTLTLDGGIEGVSAVRYLGTVNRIVDLGCGIGYTTLGLSELFPSAHVYGTQLPNTVQYQIACAVTSDAPVTIVPTIHDVGGCVDLVFASEYFEHIANPIEHLHDIINALQPKCLILANSFNTTSVGHFTHYTHHDISIKANFISKLFRKELRQYGYTEMAVTWWNRRPSVWIR